MSLPLYDDTLWTEDEWNEEPDYADLDFAIVYTNPFARTIWADDYTAYEQQRAWVLAEMDRHDGGPPVFAAADDDASQVGPCRPSAWKREIHPTCNSVHEVEVDIGRDTYLGYVVVPCGGSSTLPNQSSHLSPLVPDSSGAFRQTWKLHDPTDTVYVIKQSLLPEDDQDINHKPSFLSFYKTYQDARVMERLTASPRIVSMYAHCGLTIASEAMAGELANRIVPGTGLANQTDLDQQPFGPRNTNMTVEEKLDVALSMVTSLADLHGEPGIIVHGDVHPVQWLKAADGTIRLNDFNAAELLDYDVEYGGYCKKDRGPWGGRVRSYEGASMMS